MSYFEEHKVLATLITAGIALVATATLLYLSSIADETPDNATDDEYSGGTTGPGEKDGSPAGEAADEISQVDFQALLVEDDDGDAVLEKTFYLDLDNDGSDEALVLVRRQGDREPLDWYVYGLKDGATLVLFQHEDVAKGDVVVDGPRIVEREGIYAEGDAPCCPSGTKSTYYVWQDGNLVVSKVESSPAGAAS